MVKPFGGATGGIAQILPQNRQGNFGLYNSIYIGR